MESGLSGLQPQASSHPRSEAPSGIKQEINSLIDPKHAKRPAIETARPENQIFKIPEMGILRIQIIKPRQDTSI
jgi:hypothetical protein